MTGAIDAAAIGEHVSLLHRLAQPLIGLGMLLIASFGEDPQRPNPKTGTRGDPLPPKIRHFKIGDVDAMIRAIVTLAGERHRNVYAPLAVFRRDLRSGGKGYEKDIVAQLGLVGDFDDAEAERWAERLPLPPCYVLETSRARFQPFYLFDHPEKFVDVKPVAERLHAFTKCDFGTKDLSHVWRIPGTPNWPNAKKLATGRSPEPQSVRVAVPANGELVSLAELAALLPDFDVTAPCATRRPSRKREAADGAPAAEPPDVEELKRHLPAALRRRLEGPISGDRSKNLMALIAACCRLGLDDDAIAALITAHPLGAGVKYVGRDDLGTEIARIRGKVSAAGADGKPSTAGKAGNRQLTGGRSRANGPNPQAGAGAGNGGGVQPPDLENSEDGEDGEEGAGADGTDGALDEKELEKRRDEINARAARTLAALNRRFAVVNEAGKCIVFKRTRDPAFGDRAVLERISFDDFCRMYLNRHVEVIVRKITKKGVEYDISRRKLAPWWLEHPNRRQYLGGVTFDPTNRAPANFLNLWRGFAVTPAPGDWSLMKNHIRNVICRGEPADNEYVLNWLARLVQHPEEPGEVALVIRSTEKGTGKSLFGRYVVQLFGHHGMHITHAPHLTGRFNAHLHDCCMLFADEAFFADDKQHEGVLKGLITEYTLVIEGKYRNVITVRNRLHVLVVSNKDWVIPASVDERRFAVFEALDTHQGDRAYFAAIIAQMDNGGLEAMLHELLGRDISGFEVRDVPQTEALQAQKTLSLSSLERWWLAVLARGFLWKSRHGAPWFADWHDFYSTEILSQSYQRWCDENRPYDRKTREQLGAFFTPLYSASRRTIAHPVYEIDSIDHSELHPPPLSSRVAKTLDEIAIVSMRDQYGYSVGELEEARARFLDRLRDIPSPWGAPE